MDVQVCFVHLGNGPRSSAQANFKMALFTENMHQDTNTDFNAVKPFSVS